ncbi:PDR/VanB family oxidoreductase [Sphingobium sp.]|uniref:PDR/VanB family oxidoreductase n=1 Tax=Sphingobium sp. TaxID=1912891 RepID=UPI0028BD1C9D|nr:PDR/VanB family oxidoreductase [Sphingobium sp.]
MALLELEPIVERQVEADLELEVSRRWLAADGVVALELRSAEGHLLPEWAPGAHIDILLPDGSARQYSLCGDPADRMAWRVGVLREAEGRGGSRWLHDDIRAGDQLNVRGPRNHFSFDAATDYLFIAGGIGVTPLLPMVAAAEAAGASYRFIYGGRSLNTMGFQDELARFGDKVEYCPESVTGILDLDELLSTPKPGTLVYTCGPGGLLDAIEARASHWPPGSVRMERFSPRTPVRREGGDTEFEVELARSGRILTVPADRSLLDILEEAGTDVVSSCAEGTCGSCITTLLAGEADHRDSVLTGIERAAGDQIVVCVSRCLGKRLTLDL